MNAAPTIADADVAVRPAVDSDRGFLRTLADDTRRAEFAALELPPPHSISSSSCSSRATRLGLLRGGDVDRVYRRRRQWQQRDQHVQLVGQNLHTSPTGGGFAGVTLAGQIFALGLLLLGMTRVRRRRLA
jgi:hypothetical protein